MNSYIEPGKEPVEVESRVKRIVEEKLLNQGGGIRGVLTYDHKWLLEPFEGGTKVTQHEEYQGVGVWFLDYSWVEPAYTGANEGRKQQVLRVSSKAATTSSALESPPP